MTQSPDGGARVAAGKPGYSLTRMERLNLARFAWLSIGAALATMALKALAYFVTGSVGLLSDALESLVNLAAALMALAMLIIAARPSDEMTSRWIAQKT
jgi:divalent metal cation (Fe/Co/Zn/Cd) transporter